MPETQFTIYNSLCKMEIEIYIKIEVYIKDLHDEDYKQCPLSILAYFLSRGRCQYYYYYYYLQLLNVNESL